MSKPGVQEKVTRRPVRVFAGIQLMVQVSLQITRQRRDLSCELYRMSDGGPEPRVIDKLISIDKDGNIISKKVRGTVPAVLIARPQI